MYKVQISIKDVIIIFKTSFHYTAAVITLIFLKCRLIFVVVVFGFQVCVSTENFRIYVDLFYWYIICKLLKALTWKDLFLFILYCGSGYILKMCWVSPPIGNEVYKVLWRNDQVPGVLWPFPTVINPAVNIGRCVLLKMGAACPGHRGSVGSCLLTLPCSLTHRHFGHWLDSWVS